MENRYARHQAAQTIWLLYFNRVLCEDGWIDDPLRRKIERQILQGALPPVPPQAF